MLSAVQTDWDEAFFCFEDAIPHCPEMAQITFEIWLVRDDRIPIALFGVVPMSLLGSTAYIWLIPLQRFSLRHILQTRIMFNSWARKYTKLVANCLDPRAARFAELYGFRQTAPDIYERTI